MLYFVPFISALGGSALLCALVILLSKKLGLKWRSRGGVKYIPRLGGVAAMAAFLAVIFLDHHLIITQDILGLLIGAMVIFLFGLLDDIRDISWKWQLVFQIILVVGVIIFFGVHIDSITVPFLGTLFFSGALFWLGVLATFAWFLLLMNAINWIDGIDGLSPGIMVLAGMVLFAVSLRPEVFQPPVAILSIALVGAYLGLFIFNFPAAKIFSGTVGTFFGGFAIAYIAIFAGAKIASAFLVLSIPILDALWVAWQRVRAGHPLTIPDRRHVHFVLQEEFGWSKKRTLFALLGFVLFLSIVSMVASGVGKFVSIVLMLGLFFLMVFMRRK